MRREIYPEELSYFYQKTGEAIWHLQIVEDFLVRLYMIKAVMVTVDSISEDEAASQITKLQRKTLGQVIGLLEKGNWVSTDFIRRLKDFNSMRKWIVHNSAREDGETLYTDKGRERFLSKICQFTGLAVGFQHEIQEVLVEYANEQGVQTDKIFEQSKRTLRKLRGE